MPDNPLDKDESKNSSFSDIRFILLWWITLLLIVGFIHTSSVTEVAYSDFLHSLDKGLIQDVHLKGREITAKVTTGANDKSLRTVKTFWVEPELADVLQKHAVKFSAEPDGNWWSGILHFLLPVIVVWFIIGALLSRGSGDLGAGGSLLSVGKSKARIYIEQQIGVTFTDVAGVDEVKEELQEIITFLKEPQRYRKLGGKLPKGILLVGPPGTGKTLLARAVAGEARVPFFSISGSEFVELFVGVGAARVRDLFEQARKKAPCIIFIDELDALGRARGVGPLSGGRDEKEQTLNQLLSELDGFDSTAGVILLAATNRPEILDPALLRAGRFDRQIMVDKPDKLGRMEILKVHLRGVVASDNVSIEELAAMTPGLTGADLANLINESALLAARRNADEIDRTDILCALERIIAGLEKKNRVLNKKERTIVAYHEMGHALVALALPDTEPVQKVSIIPRGIGALGYTLRRPTEDRFLMSKNELMNKMSVLMGGRAAETIVFNETSTGAADDFAKATEIARNMVSRYGMVEEVGMVSYLEEQSPLLLEGSALSPTYLLSEKTKMNLDEAVKELVKEAFDRAIQILEDKRFDLTRGAEHLLEHETINEEELKLLLKSGQEQNDTRTGHGKELQEDERICA